MLGWCSLNELVIQRARWAVGFVFFINGALFASWATRIPAVTEQLGLTPGTLGIALFFMASATPVAMPACGALVARYGSRPVIRVLLLLACLSLLAPAFATGVWTLAAALALFGASIGSLVVAQNAQGVAIEKALERPLLNTFHGLLSLGWLAGSLGGAGAARVGLSPLVHFILVSALLLCAGLFVTHFLLVAHTDQDATGAKLAKPSIGLIILAVMSFSCLFAEGSVLDWSALYLSSSLNSAESLAAMGTAAFAATQAAGRFFGNRILEKVEAITLVRAAATLGTAGILLAVVSSQPWVVVAGFGLLGAGLSVVFPILLSTAGGDGTGAGPRVAAVATAGYIGLLAGPALIGGAGELFGLRSALLLVVALVALIPVIAGIGGLMRDPKRQAKS